MANNWSNIWESRIENPVKMTHNQLLEANGYDNDRSRIYTWSLGFALNYYSNLWYLRDGDSIYEVGCGAGAMLYPYHQELYKVGGIDLSNSLIELAKLNLPTGSFVQGEAIELNVEEKWDHLISFGLFFYFPDMEYVETVLDKMVEKAIRTISVYDIPDLATKEECENMRRLTTENYDELYKGLDHLYFTREWFTNYAHKKGLHISVFDQLIPGYVNGKYRFCITMTKNM